MVDLRWTLRALLFLDQLSSPFHQQDVPALGTGGVLANSLIFHFILREATKLQIEASDFYQTNTTQRFDGRRVTVLSYDFAAKLRTEALEKESKVEAVATARADAETSSAAWPIEELLKDGLLPYDKRIDDLEKKLLSATQNASASSSSKTPKSNKTKAPGKEKKVKPKADNPKADNPKPPRTEAKDAKRANTAGKGASKKVKPHNKGKGKAEPQDDGSD
ncbi:hypothetical protein C8J57DRAFT_1518465 [Mycena rebaudengoi]|nr:hypothetical protein C8J57DRAFT_1518465 [Mycena rebaudengoi]